MAFAIRRASLWSAASRTVTRSSFVAPSPSRASMLGDPEAAVGEGGLERGGVHVARQAVGQDRAGVGRAGVGIDGQHVEGHVHGFAQHAVEVGGGEARVGERCRRSIGGHVRLDHARALRHPRECGRSEADGQRLGPGVGGHDAERAGERDQAGDRRPRRGFPVPPSRWAARTPITPVDLTSTRSGVVPSSAAAAAAMRRAFSRPRTGGHVADLAVHHHGPEPATPDRLPAQHHRRAREVVPGENGGRGSVHVGHEQGQVGGLRLEAAVPAGAAEPAGKYGLGVEVSLCMGLPVFARLPGGKLAAAARADLALAIVACPCYIESCGRT